MTSPLEFSYSSRHPESITDYETATELTNPTDLDATSFCESEDTAR